jgi:hypothetical protein
MVNLKLHQYKNNVSENECSAHFQYLLINYLLYPFNRNNISFFSIPRTIQNMYKFKLLILN